MKRVSMKDIATAAGVSRSTVSRALSCDPSIPEATAERIRRQAESMGYERDPAYDVLTHARWGKAGQFRNTVAFLATEGMHHAGYQTGARRKAAEMGYAMDSIVRSDYPSDSAIERVLLTRGVRGLILPTFHAAEPLPDFDWSQFSVVCCSVDAIHPPFHIVRTNVAQKVEMAWAQCRARGYRRIGIALLHAQEGSNELDRRREGAAWQCLMRVSASERVPLWNEPFGGETSLDGWIEEHRPEVVIAGQPALLVQLRAQQGADGKPLPHCCLVEQPDTACTASRPERIGEVAMSILHQSVIVNDRGIPEDPFTIVIEPEWWDGDSF